ncbi:MFS transporter [Microbispora rosea subsp. aerata]|nr:MFS transporter [Microbispora rosea]GGO30637.1 MFS transporter [Microbispora rosea subsp. aerata]GIH59120.1 MFS transporter [Microbispora rosea subsp. aerata]GLJ85339.1 MFS transporter [Microbispora rosea subsp. aerata]
MRDRHQRATALVFAVHGAVAGTLATRMPWIQEHFGLGTAALGLVLLCTPIGSLVAMPMTARLSYRFGAKATTRALLALWCAAPALPVLMPGPLWLVPAFLAYGAAAGMCDLAMNAQGVHVERRLGRSVMSGLHGMWSVGSLCGAGAGALAAQAGVDARAHFVSVAVALLAVGALGSRALLDDTPAADERPPRRFTLPSRSILLIGLIGLCATFAERASGQWSAIYLEEVTGAGPGLAAAGYAVFTACMVAVRLGGDFAVRRLGPVATVRAGAVTAVVGGVLVVAFRTSVPVIAGFGLFGAGVAVVVPLVFAAAGQAARTPAEGVAGVATITWLSGLVAPPVTGWLADAFAFPFAFALVTCLVAGTVWPASALRPRPAAAPAPVGAARAR